MIARETNQLLVFTSCMLLSLLLIFSFLCLSSHADVSPNIKSFDRPVSEQILFGDFSGSEKSAMFKSAQNSQLSVDFQKGGVKRGKNKRPTRLVSNDVEGMDVFITLSSIGLKWRNIW